MVEMSDLIEQIADRTRRSSQCWAPGCRLVSVEPLTGGTSSLTFTARFDGAPEGHEEVVLKVAPPGLPPLRNRDVLRQGTLMRALGGREGVLVPRVLFEDPGDPPDVPPFLAMNLVAGECLEPILVEKPDPERAAQFQRRAFDAAGILAGIHRLDPAAISLASEPVVSIEDEVGRWVRAYETAPAHLQFNYPEVAAALLSSLPRGVRPSVNHGDYRLGNTLCDGDRVNAVIDWEIWSVGDPRIDLTWLTFFCDDSGHPSRASDQPSGMPPSAEVVTAYVSAGGEDFADLSWFEALTCFKEAAMTSLLIKRAQKTADPEMASRLMEFTPKLGVLLDMAAAKLAV